jgi:hypothetical protein
MSAKLAFCTLLLLLPRLSNFAGENDNRDFKQLVIQLSDPSFRAREQAERQLEAAGKSAIPILEKVLLKADADTRRRLQHLIERIERKLLLEPTRLTISTFRAEDLHAELQGQTGAEIELNRDDRGLLRCNYTDLPWWELFARLRKEQGMSLHWSTYLHTWLLQREPTTSQEQIVGPFVVRLNRLRVDRTVDFRPPPKTEEPQRGMEKSLRLDFELLAETKVQLVEIRPIQITQAVDDAGRSLLPQGAIKEGGNRNNRNRWEDCWGGTQTIGLSAPEREATKLSIEGKIPVVILLKRLPELQINDLSKDEQVSQSDQFKMTSNRVRFDDEKEPLIRIILERTGRQLDEDNQWFDHLRHRLSLRDAKGIRFINAPPRGVGNLTPKEIEVELRFISPASTECGDPKSLTLEKWVTFEYEIPFSFKDLPIP